MQIARWKQAWLFLSLEMIEPLFSDLWIPVSDPVAFRRKLAGDLGELIASEHNDRLAGRAHRSLALWFADQYGLDELGYLSLWVGNVFLVEGPDRVGEMAWEILVDQFADEQGTMDVSARLASAVGAVRLEHQARRGEVERRVAIQCERDLSEWDSGVLRLRNEKIEDLRNLLVLIANYNAFVEAWEHHCATLTAEECDELYLAGSRIAARTGMDRVHGGPEALYPGLWRGDLLPFLGRRIRASPRP